MGKYVFGESRPSHPFREKPLIPGYVYTLCSRRMNDRCYGIGKLAYQPSKKRWIVLCYDDECDNYFRGVRK